VKEDLEPQLLAARTSRAKREREIWQITRYRTRHITMPDALF